MKTMSGVLKTVAMLLIAGGLSVAPALPNNGNGNGNGGGQGAGDGGGNGNGSGNGNSGNAAGAGNGGGNGNGNGNNGNGIGLGNGRGNSEGAQRTYSNGVSERIRDGRLEMRDAAGRTIVRRDATILDYLRLRSKD
jgi:hypothetical protein